MTFISRRASFKLIALGSFLSSVLCGCESIHNAALSRAYPIDWQDQNQIDLRLTMDSGGRPLIPGQVLGHEVAILVDSGMTLPLLSRDLVSSEFLESASKRRANVGGVKREKLKYVPLRLGTRTMEVDMVLWDPAPSNVAPVVLGAPLFLQAIVDIDFDADRLSIVRPKSFTPPQEAPMAVSIWRGTPLVHMKIGDHPKLVCAMVDTGFQGSLALSDEVVKELNLSYDPERRRIVYAAGVGGVRRERRALEILPEVRLGGSVYANVEATHLPDSGECQSRIGAEILSQSRLVFDLKNGRMWALPRASRSSH